MNHTTLSAAAVAAALSFAVPSFAQNNQGQQSEDAKDLQTVEIKRSSTWGFSNEVRRYLSDAYEDMYANPEEAIEDLKLAVGMTEILAAATTPGGESDALKQAAQDLSRFAQKVENRQVANPDELGGPSAAVVLAIAKAQHAEAERGLEEGDESAVAYSLDSAADNLFQAHVYLKKAPSEDVGKAIYNAHRLGTQLKSLIERTTQQGGTYVVTIPEEKGDTEDIAILDGSGEAQQAGSRQDGQGGEPNVADQIPQIAPEIVEALGDAIDSASQATRGSN